MIALSNIISFCLNSIVEQYNIIAKFGTFFMSHTVFYVLSCLTGKAHTANA